MANKCSCPNHDGLLSIGDINDIRKACLDGGTFSIHYDDAEKVLYDGAKKVGKVAHISGNTWSADTVHTAACDTLRLFTCPIDAAQWLYAVNDNEAGVR
jgi:hypothetical protein